jgi:D-lactate dehydrogenase (cytochrome)
VRAVNNHAKLALEEKPTLFLEFHGTEAGTRDQIETFRQIAQAEGAIRFDWAERPEDRNRLWKARHDFYWAVKTTWPGRDALATDVCVPISRLAECLLETEEDIRSLGLIAPIAGHAGDGNFHTQPMVDRSNAKEMAALDTFLDRLAKRAIAMEGTCTGEHGIGQGKQKYLKAELGEGVAVMRALKAALDPQDIFNPGKIMPPLT